MSKTLQEAFNTMYKHLHTMKKKSANESGSCKYRGCNGNKCPVGALINDKNYSESIEAQAANEDIVLNAIKHSGYPVTDKASNLYVKMQ